MDRNHATLLSFDFEFQVQKKSSQATLYLRLEPLRLVDLRVVFRFRD